MHSITPQQTPLPAKQRGWHCWSSCGGASCCYATAGTAGLLHIPVVNNGRNANYGIVSQKWLLRFGWFSVALWQVLVVQPRVVKYGKCDKPWASHIKTWTDVVEGPIAYETVWLNPSWMPGILYYNDLLCLFLKDLDRLITQVWMNPQFEWIQWLDESKDWMFWLPTRVESQAWPSIVSSQEPPHSAASRPSASGVNHCNHRFLAPVEMSDSPRTCVA